MNIKKIKSRYIIILGILVALLPYLPIFFIALPLAKIGGCEVDEGSVNSCIILGKEIGNDLYSIGVLGWFGLITVPIGFIIILLGIIIGLIRRSNRNKTK